MSDVSAIGTDTPIAEVERGYEALGAEDFTQLILAEMANQDPLEPSDTSALLDQLAMIQSIESDEELNDTLGQLADRSDFSAAASLIGASVTTSENGLTPIGVVSVTQTDEGVNLTLEDGSYVPFSSVTSVFGQTAETGADA